jgi:hypothetical protein
VWENNGILLYLCMYVCYGYMPQHIQAGSFFTYFLCHTLLISLLLLVSMFVYLWFCLYTWLSFGAECLVFQFAIQNIKIKIYRAIIRRSQRPRGLRRGLRPLACWDYGFESRRADGYFRCLVSVVCCQVEFSVTG